MKKKIIVLAQKHLAQDMENVSNAKHIIIKEEKKQVAENKMDKNKIKYFVDLGLAISFLIVTMTGIFKFGKLLRAVGINLEYSELPMKAISAWHDWSGVALVLLVLIHLILNIDWIIGTTKGFFVKQEIENEKTV